jgi:lactate dehydrogenase-like 2-hydroxyacid dehydrogenase
MKSDVSVTWLIRSDRAAVPDIHWNEPGSNQAFQQWETTVSCPRHTLAMAEMRGVMTQLVADKLAAVDPGKPNLNPVN